MKWALLLLLVSCGAKNSSTSTPNTPQIDPALPQAQVCAPGALPAARARDEDYLSFPNFGYQDIGRCRGHALLTQKLLLLMRFNPRASERLDCDTDVVNCKARVRKLLDQVEKNNIVVVPGFSTLAEFSEHPAIRAVLKARIISYGHTYSANSVPLPGTDSRSILVFKEATRRVLLHQLPYLALNGVEVGDHGVLAYRIDSKRGVPVLCIRDPNIVPAQGQEECDNYMYLDAGRVRYVRINRPEDTVRMELFNDEDRRFSSYRQTLCKKSADPEVALD